MVQQKFAIGGSGSTYIMGLIDSEYREGMTADECKKFVAKCNAFHIINCTDNININAAHSFALVFDAH